MDLQARDMTATFSADVTLAEAQRRLAEVGQWLAVDGDASWTLGRLVEMNSTGPLRLGYGAWRYLLLGCQFLNGRGELITAGGRTVKNVAGYDLTKFMVGQGWLFGRIVTITTRTLDAVLWASDGTGIAIDEMVSPNLRLGLLDTGLNWISSSEPAGVCNADGCTKAFALTADGTQIADTIAVTGDGFKGAVLDGLVEFDESGTFINNSGGTIPDSVAGMLAIPGPTPRTGYAAAWSQTVGKLYVLGGTNPSTGAPRADAWTKRQQVESGWSSVALDPLHAPRNVRAATFSPADGRMWVLDRPTTQTRLLRIDPEAGTIDIDVPVPVLDGYRDVWLSTIEDGRVILAATTSSSHVIALLSSTPSSPRSPLLVVGARFADGELVGPPSVGYNVITVPVGHTEDGLGIGSVMPAAVASTELTSTWPALSGQIAPDQNGNGVPDSLESCVSGSDVFIAGGPLAPAWAPNISYAVDNRVTFNGRIFRTIQAHTSQVGWEPTNVPALWESPTPCGVSAWTSQTAYVVGSIVIFNGLSYRAIQAHTSQVGWEPPNTPALWQPL